MGAGTGNNRSMALFNGRPQKQVGLLECHNFSELFREPNGFQQQRIVRTLPDTSKDL